jgi:hypothetical protein
MPEQYDHGHRAYLEGREGGVVIACACRRESFIAQYVYDNFA